MEIILTLLLSYIIGILIWAFMSIFTNNVQTYGELLEELKETPAFIPIINILTFIGFITIILIIYLSKFIINTLYKFLFIEKLWNKIKDKKIKPWTK